jgi:hypothetical protein
VTNSIGCVATATKEVAVNSIVGTITPSNAKPCAGETFSLTATGGKSYLWADGNTSDKVNVSTNGPTTYNVTVTGNSGCTKVLTTTVQGVPPLPKPIISVLGVAKFCDGGSTILSSTTGPAGTQYIWTGSTATTQSITVTKTGDFTVKLKNGTCESVVSEVTKIEVLPPPPVPTVTKTGTGSTLSSSSATGNLWFFSATQNGVYTALAGAINPTYKVTKNGYYYVQFTDANGCSSKSVPIFISITGLEDALSTAQFNVFPNPTDDKLTVAIQDVPLANKFVVTNVIGQVIYTQNVSGTSILTTIDVSDWAKGTYFINVLNTRNEAIGVRKIAKVE